MPCDHPDFIARVNVHRLQDAGRVMADVEIECSKCQTPFRFIGLPAGLDLNGAAVSADGATAHLAIAPRGEVLNMIEGAPAGFAIRRH